MEEYKYPSVSYEIADQITKKTGMEVRLLFPDIHKEVEALILTTRVFASRLGAEAPDSGGEYGYMVELALKRS